MGICPPLERMAAGPPILMFPAAGQLRGYLSYYDRVAGCAIAMMVGVRRLWSEPAYPIAPPCRRFSPRGPVGAREPGAVLAGHQARLASNPVARTAPRMTRVTTCALEMRDRCPALTPVMWAPARRAMNVSCAGRMTRSPVPITAHDGMVVQAREQPGRSWPQILAIALWVSARLQRLRAAITRERVLGHRPGRGRAMAFSGRGSSRSSCPCRSERDAPLLRAQARPSLLRRG